VLMNRYFPGLLSDDGFQQFRPLSFLASNVSNEDIRAFSTRWSVTTLRGRYERTIRHYSRPRYHEHNEILFTGAVPVLKTGATRLLSPFFSWSPSFYMDNARPNWTQILLRRPELELSDPGNVPTKVTMHIEAAITDSYVSVGPGDEYLAQAFCVTRNAEHDEAVAIRRLISAGATFGIVERRLRYKSKSPSSVYYRVRQRQARMLLARLYGVPWDDFLRTLQYLRDQPKTLWVRSEV
jgi:hypothetical protein